MIALHQQAAEDGSSEFWRALCRAASQAITREGSLGALDTSSCPKFGHLGHERIFGLISSVTKYPCSCGTPFAELAVRGSSFTTLFVMLDKEALDRLCNKEDVSVLSLGVFLCWKNNLGNQGLRRV